MRSVLIGLFLVATSNADTLLPMLPLQATTLNGYALSEHPGASRLDVFLGPFCEDSRRFFPTLQTLAAETSRLDVRVHLERGR